LIHFYKRNNVCFQVSDTYSTSNKFYVFK